MNVDRILQLKGNEVATTEGATTVSEAVAELRRRNVGALVVTGEGGGVAGILSERDVVRALADGGAAVLDGPVSDLMTTEVVCCDRRATAEQLMATMTERRIRHVPVLDEGRLCGIVSIGDVVKSRLGELESEAKQLVDYIQTGR